MCSEEIHQKCIQVEDFVNCIVCCKQIQDPGKPWLKTVISSVRAAAKYMII